MRWIRFVEASLCSELEVLLHMSNRSNLTMSVEKRQHEVGSRVG